MARKNRNARYSIPRITRKFVFYSTRPEVDSGVMVRLTGETDREYIEIHHPDGGKRFVHLSHLTW